MKPYQLRQPIKANGAEVTELTLREPKGEDFIELGMPMSFSVDGSSDFKMKVVAQYISRLAGIPPSSVKTIHPQDLMSLAIEVASFFGEPESEPPPNPEE